MPNNDTAKRVARQVRAQMIIAEVRQASIAEALNLSQTATSRRLTGEVAFDVAEILIVADLLGVPVSSLLAEPVAA